MRTRATTAALLATVLLVLLPGVALAHASFDVTQLPAGSTQELTLRVPLERDAVNDLVEVLVPGAFTVDACAATEGWTCEQAETADGDTVLTLARDADGPGDAERFAVTVTAPDQEGVYAFPTIQTYDDGVEAAWIGEPGTDQPAPRIQVGDETTEVEFSGEATPHTDLASEEPVEEPVEEPSDEATEGASEAPTGDDEASPASDPVTEDEAAEDDAESDVTGEEASGDEDGPSALLLVAGVALAIMVIGGAVARFRSI